jgi:hypothetical protein
MIFKAKLHAPNKWLTVFIFWPKRIHFLIDQYEIPTQAKFDPDNETKLVKKVYSCIVFCQHLERRYHTPQGTFRAIEYRLPSGDTK